MFIGEVFGLLGVRAEVVKMPVGFLGFFFAVVDKFPVPQAERPSLSRLAPELVDHAGGRVCFGEEEGRVVVPIKFRLPLWSLWLDANETTDGFHPVDNVDWAVDLAGGYFAAPVNESGNTDTALVGVTFVATEGVGRVEVGELEVIGVGIAGPVDLGAIVRGE